MLKVDLAAPGGARRARALVSCPRAVLATLALALMPLHSIATPLDSSDTVTISWDAPSLNTDGSPLTDLAGFNVYYGSNPADLSERTSIANPGIAMYVIESLSPGTWYFAVSAYDASGNESALSDVVSCVLAAASPPPRLGPPLPGRRRIAP